MAPEVALVALISTSTITPQFRNCMDDATLVRREDAARIMCSQAFELEGLRPLIDGKTLPCPECPPPKTVRKTNVLEIIAATSVGVVLGGLIIGAVWLVTDKTN